MSRYQVARDHVAFYLLLEVLAAPAFWLIRSYLDIITLSLMAVIVVKPLYDRLLRSVGDRSGLLPVGGILDAGDDP